MPSKLEDQLRALAEAHRPQCRPKLDSADDDGDTYCRDCGIGMYIGEQRWCSGRPNPLARLVAEFQRLKRIEDAARKQSIANGVLAKRADGDGELQLARETRLHAAQCALAAALSEPSHDKA